MTYLLVTDETNKDQGKRIKFFVYGGLILPISSLKEISHQVDKIRHKYGFQPGDPLKFDTNSRPDYVTVENFKNAKNDVIDLCINCALRFSVYLIHHGIAKAKTEEKKITFGANTVLNSFNEFLVEKDGYGVCAIDRLPFQGSFDYLKKKFSFGLNFDDRNVKRLDRILLYSYTSEGASHAYSLIDVVLGAFRYCVNDQEGSEAAKAMFPKVVRLFETTNKGTEIDLKYFNLRPLKIFNKDYQQDCDELIRKLNSFLNDSAKNEPTT